MACFINSCQRQPMHPAGHSVGVWQVPHTRMEDKTRHGNGWTHKGEERRGTYVYNGFNTIQTMNNSDHFWSFLKPLLQFALIEGISFVVSSSTKVSHERHHEETHTRACYFLSVSLITFLMAHWEVVRVLHIHFQLSSPMPFTSLCMEKSELLINFFLVSYFCAYISELVL